MGDGEIDLFHMVLFLIGYVTFIAVVLESILKSEVSNPSMLRIVFVIPAVIAFFVLANGGHMIDQGWEKIVIFESTINGTSNTTERVSVAAPVSPEMWGAWHIALALLLLVYSVAHTLRLFFRKSS